MGLSKRDAKKLLDELRQQRDEIRFPGDATSGDCTVYHFENPYPSLEETVALTGEVLGLELGEEDVGKIVKRMKIVKDDEYGFWYKLRESLFEGPLSSRLRLWSLAPLSIPFVVLGASVKTRTHYNDYSKKITFPESVSKNMKSVSHETTHLLSSDYNSPVRGKLNEEGLARAVAEEVMFRYRMQGTGIPLREIVGTFVYCRLREEPELTSDPDRLKPDIENFFGFTPNTPMSQYVGALARIEAYNFLRATKIWLARQKYGDGAYAKIFRGKIRV